MKLFVTFTSPYARLARIAVHERGLMDQVEVIGAQTRQENSPYYTTNPSGRVPFLVRGDGVGMEDSNLICAYLDTIGAVAPFCMAPQAHDWEAGRLHALALSFLDGVAVWGREMRRSEEDRSAVILAHEQARAVRFADLWNDMVAHPLMTGPFYHTQAMLAAIVDSGQFYLKVDLLEGQPNLAAWYAKVAERASLVATPPGVVPA